WPAETTTGPKSSVPASPPCTIDKTSMRETLRAARCADRVDVEQAPELPRIRRRLRDAPHRVVGILRRRVVVEEGVRVLGLPRELAQRLDPLGELVVGVEVVEALGRRAVALIPRAEVAAVEADIRGRRGRSNDRRDEVLRRVRAGSVDHDVRGADPLEEG